MERNTVGLEPTGGLDVPAEAAAAEAGAAGAARGRKSVRPLSAVESDAWVGMLCTYTDLLRGLDQELDNAERLPLSSYEVLMKLAGAPKSRLRMKDIAVSMVTSASGLTRIVDDLQRRGYVERRKCATDARGLEAVLTPAGRAVYRRAEKVFDAYLRREFFDRLSADQIAALAQIWEAAGRMRH